MFNKCIFALLFLFYSFHSLSFGQISAHPIEYPQNLVEAIEQLKNIIQPDNYGIAGGLENESLIYVEPGQYSVSDDILEVYDGYECYGQALYIYDFLTDYFNNSAEKPEIFIVAGIDELILWDNHAFVVVRLNDTDYIIDFTPPYNLRMPTLNKRTILPLQHLQDRYIDIEKFRYENINDLRDHQITQAGKSKTRFYPLYYTVIDVESHLTRITVYESEDLYFFESETVITPLENYLKAQNINDLVQLIDNREAFGWFTTYSKKSRKLLTEIRIGNRDYHSPARQPHKDISLKKFQKFIHNFFKN